MSQTVIDTHLANDVFLCVTNDGDIYRKYSAPLIESLKSEHAAGKYNHSNAAVLWYHILVYIIRPRGLKRLCLSDSAPNFVTMYAAAGFISDYYLEAITE